MERDLVLSKLFIVQMADAEPLVTPLRPGHPLYVAGQPPRMSWSRNARHFLCEGYRGGYLPVVEILRALLDLGWEGWLSYEIFSRTLANPEPETLVHHASSASLSWSKLLTRLELENCSTQEDKGHAFWERPYPVTPVPLSSL
ncbi:uncharacterized protein ATNIH1004_008851 [Aspergillus tanneri]|uniref:Uncharacterized protein n=1 Tax=Aspergillus tanneri TaxID=1220188 RepID=A0A5M9MCA9_9EURO|nr:uncharacterized protein ATNIH1004_008851 [Aspergillus tanneri]KAA8644645.1 hypothetical protein ATNIH1004_008851 [Aspergillus tanneri]